MAFKIVLSTAGTAGDLNPFVAIALELKARGHKPFIATQREFQATVEDEGIGFYPLRPSMADVRDELGLDPSEIIERTTRVSTGLGFAVRHIAMPFLRRTFDDMMAATADADLVVTHTSAFAARLAAEKRGLPWLSAALSPFTFMSACDPPLLSAAPAMKVLRDMTGARSDAALLQIVKLATTSWTRKFQRLRIELGMPKSANPLFEGQFSRQGTLGLYSPLFGAAQADFPEECTLTGFCFFDHRHGAPQSLSPDILAFLRAGPAPLVFTLGSALVLDPGDFYDVSVAVAHRLGQRAIILVGPEAASVRAGKSAPENVFVADYAPHSELFPHAAAIIHHGGMGTTAQALRAGKPQLVVPHFADQPDNANRVLRLGVGSTVAAAAYTPGRARRELSALLASPAYGVRAVELARALRKEDGTACAVDIIEMTLGDAGLRRIA